MRYLSILVFACAFAWSWNLIHSANSISYETHVGLQNKMSELIIQSIQSKKPNATEIQVIKIWTEPMGESKVKTHFVYQYNDILESGEKTAQVLEGYATLSRQTSEDAENDNWKLEAMSVSNDMISFDEGLVVKPGEGPEDVIEVTTETTPAATESAPATVASPTPAQ